LFVAALHDEIDLEKKSNDKSFEYIKKHWKIIPRALGLERAYWLDPDDEFLFFECENFDTEANRCKDYENRPWICREFPYYDHEILDDRVKLPDGCAYNEWKGKEKPDEEA
jgi:Fe-S-cluster containining protein